MPIPRTPESDALLGRLLIKRGYVSQDQLAQAKATAGNQGDLLLSLQSMAVLTARQVEMIERLYQRQLDGAVSSQPAANAQAAPAAQPQRAPATSEASHSAPRKQRHVSPEEAQAMAAVVAQHGVVAPERLQRAVYLQSQQPTKSLFKVLVDLGALTNPQAKHLADVYKQNRRHARTAPQSAPPPGYAGGYPVEPTYAYPQQVPGAFAPHYNENIRQLAIGHRLMCIWLYVSVGSWIAFFLFFVMLVAIASPNPGDGPPTLAILLLPFIFFVIAACVVFLVGYFMTAIALDEVVLFLVLFLLGLSLIGGIIMAINGASVLKRHGYQVGWCGVPKSALR